MVPLVQIISAKRRFVAVVNELVLERRLRVHELDGGMTILCVNKNSFGLRRFRRLAVWSWRLNTHKVPSTNDRGLRRLLAVRQRPQDSRKKPRNSLQWETFHPNHLRERILTAH